MKRIRFSADRVYHLVRGGSGFTGPSVIEGIRQLAYTITTALSVVQRLAAKVDDEHLESLG